MILVSRPGMVETPRLQAKKGFAKSQRDERFIPFNLATAFLSNSFDAAAEPFGL